MWGLPQKKNARRAYKIRLCGHLRRYKKIVKKTYIILYKDVMFLYIILICYISKISVFIRSSLLAIKDIRKRKTLPSSYERKELWKVMLYLHHFSQFFLYVLSAKVNRVLCPEENFHQNLFGLFYSRIALV